MNSPRRGSGGQEVGAADWHWDTEVKRQTS